MQAVAFNTCGKSVSSFFVAFLPWYRKRMIAVLYLFLAVVAFTVLAVGWTTLREGRRRDRLAESAVRLGYSFDPSGESLLREGITEAPFFVFAVPRRQGRVRNVMRKQINFGDLFICDYHYWTGGSGGRFDHRQTVACFRVEHARFPDFCLRPQQNAVDRKMLQTGLKLASMQKRFIPSAGFKQALEMVMADAEDPGIQFPEDPQFGARYRLTSHSEDRVKALFQPALRQLLEEQQTPVSIESAGRWFLFYRKNTTVKPEEIQAFCEEASRALEIFSRAQA